MATLNCINAMQIGMINFLRPDSNVFHQGRIYIERIGKFAAKTAKDDSKAKDIADTINNIAKKLSKNAELAISECVKPLLTPEIANELN